MRKCNWNGESTGSGTETKYLRCTGVLVLTDYLTAPPFEFEFCPVVVVAGGCKQRRREGSARSDVNLLKGIQ